MISCHLSRSSGVFYVRDGTAQAAAQPCGGRLGLRSALRSRHAAPLTVTIPDLRQVFSYFLTTFPLPVGEKSSIIVMLRYEPDKANPFFGCESRFTEVTLW